MSLYHGVRNDSRPREQHSLPREPPPPVGLLQQPFFRDIAQYLIVVPRRRIDAKIPFRLEDWAVALSMPCVRCGTVVRPFLRRKDTRNRRRTSKSPDYTTLYCSSTCSPSCHRSKEAMLERESICSYYGV